MSWILKTLLQRNAWYDGNKRPNVETHNVKSSRRKARAGAPGWQREYICTKCGHSVLVSKHIDMFRNEVVLTNWWTGFNNDKLSCEEIIMEKVLGNE